MMKKQNESRYQQLISFTTPKYTSWGDNLLWSYSNLQMLSASISIKAETFGRQSYMVRAKVFKAYRESRWSIRDMYELNRAKIKSVGTCWYCRSLVSPTELTADHVFPRSKGGENVMENIIFVCKSCNSSKGKSDLMEFLVDHGYYPENLVLEQYLKEVYFFSRASGLLDKTYEEVTLLELPFKPQSVLLFQNGQYLLDILQHYKTEFATDIQKEGELPRPNVFTTE